MAIEFKAASTPDETAALESETKEMMQSVCAAPRGQGPLFVNTCNRLATDL